MFDPSIKKENFIVIEDHYEDSKVGFKEQEERLPLHRKAKENKNLGKTTKKGKHVAQHSTGPITRATTRLSRIEEILKGTGRFSENKDYHLVDSDQIPDIPEAMESVLMMIIAQD
jgi:hypothetical protein